MFPNPPSSSNGKVARAGDSSALRGALAKGSDQFRQADVTFWAVFAFSSWAAAAIAVAGGALIPTSWLDGLHASRFNAPAIEDLKTQLSDLEDQAATLKVQGGTVLQRLALNEQDQHEVTQRVGALELTVPKLREALAGAPTGTDQTLVTGDISGVRTTTTIPAEGGTATVSTSPLINTGPAADASAQPMPKPLDAPAQLQGAFGVALGSPFDPVDGPAQWHALSDKAGTLLLGLEPLLGTVDGSAQKRLVVGPLSSEASARQLCGGFAQLGIACLSVPFVGTSLPGT